MHGSPSRSNPGQARAELPAGPASHLLCPAAFPYAATITADHASQISNDARRIVGKAVLLCKPRLPARTLQGVLDCELAELVRECRELLERQSRHSSGPSPLNEDEQLFDDYFGIVRHTSPDALALGVAWGLLTLVYEANRPHSLVPAELAVLTNGFFRLAAPFLPTAANEDGIHAARPEATIDHRQRHAFERWKNGHLMFVALTDGLVLAHLQAISAIERNEPVGAVSALRDAGAMLAASAVAMRLAGDMSEADYDEVRTLMSPPYVPRPLSGLFNSDHRQLMRATKRLGVLLRQPAPELAWAREEYWHALNDAYHGHRWVCQQLVREAPSIAGASRGHSRAAPEEIEGFAKRALHFAGCIHATSRPDIQERGD